MTRFAHAYLAVHALDRQLLLVSPAIFSIEYDLFPPILQSYELHELVTQSRVARTLFSFVWGVNTKGKKAVWSRETTGDPAQACIGRGTCRLMPTKVQAQSFLVISKILQLHIIFQICSTKLSFSQGPDGLSLPMTHYLVPNRRGAGQLQNGTSNFSQGQQCGLLYSDDSIFSYPNNIFAVQKGEDKKVQATE